MKPLTTLCCLAMLSMIGCKTVDSTSGIRDTETPSPTYVFCKNYDGDFVRLEGLGSSCAIPDGQFCYLGDAQAASEIIDGYDLHDFYTAGVRGIRDGVITIGLSHSEGPPESMIATRCPASVQAPAPDDEDSQEENAAHLSVRIEQAQATYFWKVWAANVRRPTGNSATWVTSIRRRIRSTVSTSMTSTRFAPSSSVVG